MRGEEKEEEKRGGEEGKKRKGKERIGTFTCKFSFYPPNCVFSQVNPSLAGGAEPTNPHQVHREKGRINDILTSIIISVHFYIHVQTMYMYVYVLT